MVGGHYVYAEEAWEEQYYIVTAPVKSTYSYLYSIYVLYD